MSEQNLKGTTSELFLGACLSHIAQEIERNNHALAEEVFRTDLQGLMERRLSNATAKESPLSYLAMVMEGFVFTVAKITVTMAAIDPLTLEKTGALSADEAKLLRREIEDSIVELVNGSLKKYVLEQHLELTEFKEGKES